MICQAASQWDRIVPELSEDGLLLAEATHRVANEVAAAIAAMRLARNGARGNVGERMIDAAIGRLEGFGEVVRALRIPAGTNFDLSCGIKDLCEGLCAARDGTANSMVSLDLVPFTVDGETARRVMMVTAELIYNAIRHSLERRPGHLAIILRGDDREVRLAVVDDGPGIRPGVPTAGGGMGGHIVSELVKRGGGELTCRTGPLGTRIKVVMPIGTGQCEEPF